jgi:hypothetical protein
MIDFTIRHNKAPLNKVIAVQLPMNADNLSDLLQELGFEPPEKLKVNSTGKPYTIELTTDTNMGFAIVDRLCDNDTIAELNNLCMVICKCSDQDYIYQTIRNSDVRCINGIKKLFADRFMEFSDKLVLNTSLERKPTDFSVKGCIIEKAISVSHRKFESIAKAPLNDEPLIADNKESMYFDSKNNIYHCLLIYDRDFGDGIVINSEGSNYARYAQYVPLAKTIYEQYRATHLNELRFCCPIEIYQHIKDYPKDNCILDNVDMAGYADEINAFIYENDLPAEHERGLMHWYHPEGPDDEIAEKVYSAHCTVEIINGELTGVITAKIIGELSDESMERFTDYCIGQLSDGWGESLEQKYMRTENGEINISFWSDDDSWALVTEDEYMSDNTQDMEMSM